MRESEDCEGEFPIETCSIGRSLIDLRAQTVHSHHRSTKPMMKACQPNGRKIRIWLKIYGIPYRSTISKQNQHVFSFGPRQDTPVENSKLRHSVSMLMCRITWVLNNGPKLVEQYHHPLITASFQTFLWKYSTRTVCLNLVFSQSIPRTRSLPYGRQPPLKPSLY